MPLPFPGVIEKRDSEPLLNILNMVGGWPVAMDKWNETAGKYRPVCRLQGAICSTQSCPQANHLLLGSPKGSFLPESI